MNAGIKNLLKRLSDFEEKDPKSRGLDLRLDLADMIIEQLNGRGWTQGELAMRTGMKEPQISRILTASANCTFDTAGRILFALGVKAKLTKRDEQAPIIRQTTTVMAYRAHRIAEVKTYGKYFTQTKDKTAQETVRYLVGAH